jgi:Uma2 family endonuclease
MSTTTRITVEQFDAMTRQGLFSPREEHHVELIHGEIVPMSPIGPPHHATVSELNEWSFEALPSKAVRVLVQGPIGIPALDSEPEPDIVWARRQDYRDHHPTPDDVLLLIEVSESSLDNDRGLKARLYAEAGISDYWIVNLPGRCVEVRRDPHEGAYRSVETYHTGQDVRPLAFPEVSLPVARVFPDEPRATAAIE